MQLLDLKVAQQTFDWLNQEQTVWLCTVLRTYGSSPREPGSMLAANEQGIYVGSLSGGCIEEDFLQNLISGKFQYATEIVRYGAGTENNAPQVSLPCGGVLEVLIERLPPTPENKGHSRQLLDTLRGQEPKIRTSLLGRDEKSLASDNGLGPRVEQDDEKIKIRVGPAARLIIAGASAVAEYCAQYACSLGFEVFVCDPREELHQFQFGDANLMPVLPSEFIRSDQACHRATAVVALTHDPRIDDLALMEAVLTEAFYIGAMGSRKTSQARAERLARIGQLNAQQLSRIHMPIGLAIGSKTPAEIALSVMADILRVQRGISRDAV